MKELSPEQVTDLIRHWDATLDDPTADYPDTSPDADPSDAPTESDVCWADAPTASAPDVSDILDDTLGVSDMSNDVLVFLGENPLDHKGSDVRYLGDIQQEIRDYFDDPSDVTNQPVENFNELKRKGEIR